MHFHMIDFGFDFKRVNFGDIVWKGRQRAVDELYGNWDESFQCLYNFKAEIELRSPGSVVEIDLKQLKVMCI